jgi:hypothetical protein
VELGGEDGPSLVKHAFVAAVVEVDEILLELAGKGASVNGITVVLAGDVALARGQVQCGNVVGTVAILELDGLGSDGKGQKLVAQANAHDRNGRGLHKTSKVEDGLLAVGRVTGAVGDEDSIEVVGDLVDWVVIGEDRYRGAAADKAAENVLLHTAVNQGNVEGSVRRGNHEWSLGADALDQVDLARVDETLVLVGVILAANGDTGQRGALLTKVRDNLSGVHARDGGNALAGTPSAKALHSCPMAILLSNIRHDNTGALNVGRLEVLEEVELVALARGNTVVADEGLGEDENLAAVRGVGHGLGISHQGGGKHGLSRDVGVRAERLSVENGAVLLEAVSIPPGTEMGTRRTLMVKVASVLGAAAVALDTREGIDRPLLPSTAGLLRKRVWLGRREARPATLGPEALGRRVARRENILTSTVKE